MQDKDVKFSGKDSELHDDQESQGLEVDINTDENLAGSTHLNDEIGDESELNRLREELQAQKDKYLRLFADFDNYRKRTDREQREREEFAGRKIITSLLDVLDDCDRAEKQLAASKENKETKSGVQLVFNKLRSVLQSQGVKPMESIGTPFDTEKHEAVAEIPAPNPDLKGKVLDEVTKGYYLNGKILRFAKVIVGK
jgi:molecular chaperone GrpE